MSTTTLRKDAILAGLDHLDEFNGCMETKYAEVKPELQIETPFH